MTIPPFTDSGNLPEGIHDATWDEIVERFGTNERRRELLEGLRQALDSLQAAGCRRAYIDGSFVTDYFQQDKVTGERKGIVALALEGLP